MDSEFPWCDEDMDNEKYDALMSQQDHNRIKSKIMKEGYMTALTEAKEHHLQIGFDRGFAKGMKEGMQQGQRFGILSCLRSLNESKSGRFKKEGWIFTEEARNELERVLSPLATLMSSSKTVGPKESSSPAVEPLTSCLPSTSLHSEEMRYFIQSLEN